MIILLKSQLAKLGGAEKITLQMAKAFAKEGASVTILTSDTPPSFVPEPNIRVISHTSSSKMSFGKVQEFDEFCMHHIKELQARTVFGLDRNRFQTHLRASNGVHAAFLEQRKKQDSFLKKMSFHINPLHRTLLNIERLSFEHPELQMLFVNSRMVREEILRFYKTDPAKIHVVHNGVEWQQMQEDFDAWPLKRAGVLHNLKLKENRHHFLFIGHNYRRKGLDRLLNALAPLKNKNFHLSVVGKERNSETFQKQAALLGLQDRLSFFGQRSDIRSFYQLADTLVVPSYYDPFANVTVEALAMGLFVISSQTNGGHEVLTQESGYTFSSNSDLTEALEEALERPKTQESALRVRDSISHLDFSHQLRLFTNYVI